ncbi:CesT family type III secretion system chaperone [Simkania negevensis]|uniref:CesT family type III secretion system chaperone n=1 Tax=Simkania negevensis TaxID=83561 RepID=A0ABS3ARK3_9BACT|nr:CesT family type III secretion system chaperone [Simkania negevensis]
MGPFEELLKELALALDIDIVPEDKETCLLLFEESLPVQIEIMDEKLLIGAKLGEVHPGKSRELILIEALKANNAPYPRFGTLAYSNKTNQLIQCEMINMDGVRGEELKDLLASFVKKAQVWKEALEQGVAPQIDIPGSKTSSAPFGLSS